METVNDDFSTFNEIAYTSDHGFVEKLQSMLWPSCKWFKKINDKDQHIIIEQVQHNSVTPTSTDTPNSNLPDVFACIETDQNYYFLASYRGTTLQDLITYNPGVLSSNLKKSFITYQLSRTLASLHGRGILHGGLKASNILVDENLWVQLAGIEFGPNPTDFGKSNSCTCSQFSLITL